MRRADADADADDARAHPPVSSSSSSRGLSSQPNKTKPTANQGIGKEIARQLAAQGLTVVATARGDLRRSAAACDELSAAAGPALASSGGRLLPASLDVADDASVSAFAGRLSRGDFGDLSGRGAALAILINNAGIAAKGDTFGPEEARLTLDTNFRGTRRVTRALRPLMRRSCAVAAATRRAGDGGPVDPDLALLPRVVNLSSSAASLAQFDRAQAQDAAQALKKRFVEAALVADEARGDALLDALAGEFERAVADGTWRQKGWLGSMYSVSKVALTAYGRQLAARGSLGAGAGAGDGAGDGGGGPGADADAGGGGNGGGSAGGPFVAVDVHPGYISTAMSSYKGTFPPTRGADTPVWAALLPAAEARRASGLLYHDRKPREW
jgi:carbonyl reductase 1